MKVKFLTRAQIIKNKKIRDAEKEAANCIPFSNPWKVARKVLDPKTKQMVNSFETFNNSDQWYLSLQRDRELAAAEVKIYGSSLATVKKSHSSIEFELWKKTVKGKRIVDLLDRAKVASKFAALDRQADKSIRYAEMMGYNELVFQPGYTVKGDTDTPEGRRSAGCGSHDFTPENFPKIRSEIMEHLRSLGTDTAEAKILSAQKIRAKNKRGANSPSKARRAGLRAAKRAGLRAAKKAARIDKVIQLIDAMQCASDFTSLALANAHS